MNGGNVDISHLSDEELLKICQKIGPEFMVGGQNSKDLDFVVGLARDISDRIERYCKNDRDTSHNDAMYMLVFGYLSGISEMFLADNDPVGKNNFRKGMKLGHINAALQRLRDMTLLKIKED